MNSGLPITDRLKALRNRAGLSVRDLAQRAGMSSSGYMHYENPERFKDETLPLAQARLFAAALEGTGVTADEVMALTGIPARNLVSEKTATAFAEGAKPYIVTTQEHRTDLPQPLLGSLFGTNAVSPSSYLLTESLPAFAMNQGDVVVVDLARLPQPGEVSLVSIFDDDHATESHEVMLYLPPYLSSGRAGNQPLLRVDDNRISVRHPVVGLLRGLPSSK
jgi:transcriptional regulator with XRE-family HTH domain